LEDTDVRLAELVASRYGVQPWQAATGCVVWVLAFFLWGFTGELVCTIAGQLYPMYASFKALEALEGAGKDAVREWLIYWVTYASFYVGEGVFYRMLVAQLPFYHLLRLAFIVWLFLPMASGAKGAQGAQGAYTWVVRPILRKFRPSLDAALMRSVQDLHDAFHGRGDLLRNSAGAAVRGVGYIRELGIEDAMAQELAKAAAVQIAGAVCSEGQAMVKAMAETAEQAEAEEATEEQREEAEVAQETTEVVQEVPQPEAGEPEESRAPRWRQLAEQRSAAKPYIVDDL